MTIKVTYNVTDVYMTQSVSPVYINVSYSGGGSGAAVWGSITGTLSNQTDLQNALNAKFDDPTGTTAQYLRGDGTLATFPTITSGTVTSVGLSMPSAFAVANSPVTSSGTLAVTATGDTTQYIAGDGSLVAFPITGQAGTLVREVRNNSGATITKGTVVYINGASGNKPTIAKAIATTDATSAQTFGLVQANINNNSNGYIVAFGDLDGLDTSAYTEGAQLYLSSTVLGGYTITKQYAPNHLVYIGVVTRSHVNQGRIEVRIQNGYELDEIHDVSAQTPSNNDGLFYNSTSTLWENKSIATALGYTPVPTTRTITINGVTFDLSADRTYTIAAGISGTIATGQVAYATAANTIGGSNNLFWDNANGALAIGGTTIDTNIALQINSAKGIRISGTGGGFGYGIIRGSETTGIANNGSLTLISSTNTLAFNTGGSEAFRVASNRNISIGTISDLGTRLGVVGDTLLRGSGATSATTALTVQNSSSSNLLRILNDGLFRLGNENVDIFPSGNGSTANVNGRGLVISTNATSQQGVGALKVIGNYTSALGSDYGLWISHSFSNVTGGTATHSGILLNQTINQTGGANGITRGLYVNPTLTAAADFRAIEVSAGVTVLAASVTAMASLRIPSGTAPTSPVNGDIWFDGTDIKMRIGGVTKTFTLI